MNQFGFSVELAGDFDGLAFKWLGTLCVIQLVYLAGRIVQDEHISIPNYGSSKGCGFRLVLRWLLRLRFLRKCQRRPGSPFDKRTSPTVCTRKYERTYRQARKEFALDRSHKLYLQVGLILLILRGGSSKRRTKS